MPNTVSILRLRWKTGLVALVTMSLVFGGLFLSLKSALAGSPKLTVLHLGVNNSVGGGSFTHNVSANGGQQVKFYVEIHNTNVPSTALNVKVKSTLPLGTFTTGNSTVTISADNANSVSDNVALTVNGGGQMQYVAGSTYMTWDKNGDGNFEYNNTQLPDGIVTNGIVLGNQNGCNQYIIQISYSANVVLGPSPTPEVSVTPHVTVSPTPITSASPSPTATPLPSQATPSPSASPVLGESSPDTGLSVLGLVTLFSAGPIGLALAKFGRRKKDDKMAKFAKGMVDKKREED